MEDLLCSQFKNWLAEIGIRKAKDLLVNIKIQNSSKYLPDFIPSPTFPNKETTKGQ